MHAARALPFVAKHTWWRCVYTLCVDVIVWSVCVYVYVGCSCAHLLRNSCPLYKVPQTDVFVLVGAILVLFFMKQTSGVLLLSTGICHSSKQGIV